MRDDSSGVPPKANQLIQRQKTSKRLRKKEPDTIRGIKQRTHIKKNKKHNKKHGERKREQLEDGGPNTQGRNNGKTPRKRLPYSTYVQQYKHAPLS